jgi:hypothetical protein
VKAVGLVMFPPRVVSDTATAPAAWGGSTTDTVVGLVTSRCVPVTPPKVTFVVVVRLVPWTVIVPPPVSDPVAGVTEVRVGGG